jgi:hypothetical protein
MSEDYTIFNLFDSNFPANKKQVILDRLKLNNSIELDSTLDSLLIYGLSTSLCSQLEDEFKLNYSENQPEKIEYPVVDDLMLFPFPLSAISELRSEFDAAYEESAADFDYNLHEVVKPLAESSEEVVSHTFFSNSEQSTNLDDLLNHPLQPESSQRLRDEFDKVMVRSDSLSERINSFANRNSRSEVWGLLLFAIITVFISLIYFFGGVKNVPIYSESKNKDGEVNNIPATGNKDDVNPSLNNPDTASFNTDSSKMLSPPPKTEVQKWLADELSNMRNQFENLVDASSDDTIQRFLGAHEIVQINQNDLRRLSPYATVPRGNIGNEEIRNSVRSKNLLRYIELRLVLLEKNYLEGLAISDCLLRDAHILLDREYMEKERKGNVKMLHSAARINFCVSIILEKNAGNLLLTAEDWKRKGIIDESDYLKMKQILSNILQLN